MTCLSPRGSFDAPEGNLLAVFTLLRHTGHGGLHSTGPVETRLGLKVPGGLELQALIGSLRDARETSERLPEPGAKPEREEKTRRDWETEPCRMTRSR